MHASDSTSRTFSVSVPGCDLFALETGDASAPPLVMLHGGPGASHDYLRPQLDRLTEAGRRLVYYDQRGSGRSALSPGGTWAGIGEHVDDLVRVHEATGAATIDLCGYSFGAVLALHYAIRFPTRVGKLLLLSSAPPRAAWGDEMKARLKAASERESVAALKASLDMSDRKNRFAVLVAKYFYDPRQAPQLTPFLVRDKAEAALLQSLVGYDLLPALQSLTLDALFIHGADDPIPIAAAREAAAALQAPLVELAACGHVPYIEQPDGLFAAALPFLRG